VKRDLHRLIRRRDRCGYSTRHNHQKKDEKSHSDETFPEFSSLFECWTANHFTILARLFFLHPLSPPIRIEKSSRLFNWKYREKQKLEKSPEEETFNQLLQGKTQKTWRSGAAPQTHLTQRRKRCRGAKGAASHKIVPVFLLSHDRGGVLSHPVDLSFLRVFASLRLCVLSLIVFVLQKNHRHLHGFCEITVQKP
jgi:hypothetical protein